VARNARQHYNSGHHRNLHQLARQEKPCGCGGASRLAPANRQRLQTVALLSRHRQRLSLESRDGYQARDRKGWNYLPHARQPHGSLDPVRSRGNLEDARKSIRVYAARGPPTHQSRRPVRIFRVQLSLPIVFSAASSILPSFATLVRVLMSSKSGRS